MDKIKISICMPTRNRANFIGEALESIISQADDTVEIVVVDGASTDNTALVVRKFQQRFKNLAYYRQEENGGVDRDMAKALELARGQYCWLFSDDDLIKPLGLQRILEEIKSGYEIYLCNITACNLFLKPYKEMFWLSRDVPDRVFNLHDNNELITYLNKANSIGALFSYWSSIIVRRQEWITSGFDSDFDGSAYALAASLFSFFGRRCRLKYIRDSQVYWRNDNTSFQNEGGLVKRFLLDFNGYLKLADKYLTADSKLRGAFLRVMRREHPWYTIIHVLSLIDNFELWAQFKSRLLVFGYNKRLMEFFYILGKHRNIVSFAVAIKRKLARNLFLNKIKNSAYNAVTISRRQNLQIAVFNYLLIFNIFAGAFTVFRQPFEFYLGYVFIISFLFLYIYRFRSAPVNTNFILIVIILTLSSFINVCLGNDTVFLMAKQVSGILITGTAYYILIKINNYEIEKLFKIYLQIAVIVAAIGIFQEFSYILGFKMGYDYKWMWFISKWECCTAERLNLLRLNSIFMEPSHFAITMAPAFFFSFVDIFKRSHMALRSKWGSLVIIVSYILTFSAIAYIAVLISILLFPYRKKLLALLVIAILIPTFLFTAYSILPDIRMRVDDTFVFISHPSVSPKTHMSVYSLVSNAFVSLNSFLSSPLFGLGLGSHPVSYDKFFGLGVTKGLMQYDYPEVCRGDSGSLFLRLLSETGLFGILVVFYFMFKFRIKTDNFDSLSVISNAILILFILQLLRQGHFFYNGLLFFVWAYYFAYLRSNAKIIKGLVEKP